MATTIHDLQESRAGLFEGMKEILDLADSEKRDLSAEERAQYDEMEADLDSVGDQVETKQADARRRSRLTELGDEFKQVRNPGRGGNQPTDSIVPAKGSDGAAAVDDIYTKMEKEMSLGSNRHQALKNIVQEYNSSEDMQIVRTAVRQFIQKGMIDPKIQERAALQMDSDTAGGTLVMPEEFVARLVKQLDELVFMRRLSTVLPLTTSEAVGVPSLENDPADGDWTSELLIGGTDTTMTLGTRKLHPHPVGKLLKVSKTLLRRSAIPVDTLVRDRLAYKFALTEEKGFLTGNGANQPLGIFSASDDGISTSQDVSTDNTTTAITADGLINAKFNLETQYLASADLRWIFHRTAVRNIRKLKDGNGQYLWIAGLNGMSDTILEVPFEMSENAPATFTSGLYVGIIGDLQHYWIAESLRFELQRLDELYAATNEVGYVGRLEADGMPVWEKAFTRVTLG